LYGDTYALENTLRIVEDALHVCMETALPFLIGGDFNLSPEELGLAASPSLHTSLQIISPSSTTCRTPQRESNIDFWVAGGGMVYHLGPVATDEATASTPHVAVSLHLRPLSHNARDMCVEAIWARRSHSHGGSASRDGYRLAQC
jgi:hypothetical protein